MSIQLRQSVADSFNQYHAELSCPSSMTIDNYTMITKDYERAVTLAPQVLLYLQICPSKFRKYV